MVANGPTVHITAQTRLQASVMAIAAALVILVPVVTNSVVELMVERNHEELVRLRCTGTPGTSGSNVLERARAPGVPGSLLNPR